MLQQQSSVATATHQNAGNAVDLVTPRSTKAKPEVVLIHRVNLKTLLLQQDGRFVGIDFKKIDGQARMLNGRLGVKYALMGGENTVMSDERAYFTMFDIQIRQYRTVNLATVSGVRAGGKVYTVVD